MADLATDLEALVRSSERGKEFGITANGFVPKPLGRLVDEKLAAARVLFGDDIDLTAGSAVRKVLELMCVEELRCWEHLDSYSGNTSVVTAEGSFLSGLGEELGISRPYRRAVGTVTISLATDLPSSDPELVLERGTRLLSGGGHDYFIGERVELVNTRRSALVPVIAFVPGPAQNLNASSPDQLIAQFNQYDHRSDRVRSIESRLGEPIVEIDHGEPTTGGELVWSDEEYRDLLLAYPRNIWSPDAIRIAVSLVPGVRQVLVKDLYGGLDINQSIFGNFSFVERLFSQERSLASPYFFTIVVAPGDGAIWLGPSQLKARVEAAVDEIRPIGIFPRVEEASQIAVSLTCDLAVEGLPVPSGDPAAVNESEQAKALKQRILNRIRRYVSGLQIAEAVRFAEVLWAIMEEPGVTNCTNLRLRRFPASVGSTTAETFDIAACGSDLSIGESEVAVLVEDLDPLRIL
ncbi:MULTISPECIES: hypothetical protein [unclassified Salinibacterium]|uniref:hypothetical protein n=1 Tax=unclassified Salinibacterium TaxID=2632331 RepID=UPI0018CD2AD8|nr:MULTISPECIES: hypothetical protein [unclassified Salinibacterium]MBH0053132.1 hypothetical protein [Salinibacterium sp. SWN139]MBH0082398.1 hypothetical protein [Salinibacterium sp. SWN167]